MSRLPQHRWQIAPPDPQADRLAAQLTQLRGQETPTVVAQALINRGLRTPDQVAHYLNSPHDHLPDPALDFTDLTTSVDLLAAALDRGAKIAICGDYDADGMTSTALLLRALRAVGGQIHYEIPSRMQDGYGINRRILEKFHQEGVELVLTVDNGIAAYEAIAHGVALGLTIIVTDHHDIPAQLPPAQAILNPKLIPSASVYRSIAGVGVAYLLAVALAERLGSPAAAQLPAQMLELFTLGTIADLAALTGINRTLVQRGLRLLGRSQILGVQALIAAAGAADQTALRPEDIGFKLGPRINAIGRIGDPQTVIELLTTEDPAVAADLAAVCEATNRQRQDLCTAIEAEAIELIEQELTDYRQQRVLVVVKAGWHHGVIGIVASRLVERYGVPVFIGTDDEAAATPQIRGSVRTLPEFNVFAALEFCHDLLNKYGGHPAAGGFSLSAERLPALRERLSQFAHGCLEPQHLYPPIAIDAQLDLGVIDAQLYAHTEALQPCGIGNPEPIFSSANVRVADQRPIGKDSSHLKVTLVSDDFPGGIKAVGWRWGEYFPLPDRLDVAYRLKENHWQHRTTIELELVSARWPQGDCCFTYDQRPYRCRLSTDGQQLVIVNHQGAQLLVHRGQKKAPLVAQDGSRQEVDVTLPFFFALVKQAQKALATAP